MEKIKTTKEKIHDFFDKPESLAAKLVQFFIFLLALAKAGIKNS